VFDEGKTSRYIYQVLQAFVYLHGLDVIHRDLKPENILRCFDTIKIADFGWSVYAPESKLRGTFCGTLDYVAPEMVQGEKYDFHTDNWSIGILTYEMLTGKPPFEKTSRLETLDSIISSNVNLPDFLSNDAKDFVRRLLLLDPVNRLDLSVALSHLFILKYN
jgi:serine/threonine protein kinase